MVYVRSENVAFRKMKLVWFGDTTDQGKEFVNIAAYS